MKIILDNLEAVLDPNQDRDRPAEANAVDPEAEASRGADPEVNPNHVLEANLEVNLVVEAVRLVGQSLDLDRSLGLRVEADLDQRRVLDHRLGHGQDLIQSRSLGPDQGLDLGQRQGLDQDRDQVRIRINLTVIRLWFKLQKHLN